VALLATGLQEYWHKGLDPNIKSICQWHDSLQTWPHACAISKGKGKEVPLHAMEALGGERRYSSYSYLCTRWRWVVSITPRPHFYPRGKDPPVPTGQEAGWAPEPVWTQKAREKILCPHRGSNPDRPVIQPVVRHYTAWTNPAPCAISTTWKCKGRPIRSYTFRLPLTNMVWTQLGSDNSLISYHANGFPKSYTYTDPLHKVSNNARVVQDILSRIKVKKEILFKSWLK
jgi:hypothetical protein